MAKMPTLAVAFATVMAVTSMGAIANQEAVQEAERTAFQARQTSIDSGVNLLDNVRAALLASYTNTGGWPASPAALTATGYIANINSAWGSSVQGAVAGGGNSYVLTLVTPTEEVAMGISGKTGGAYSGTTVTMSVPVPASATVLSNALSRFVVAGKPELNQMQADIDMANHSLVNVRTVTATALHGGSAAVDDLVVNNSMSVAPDASFARNVSVGQKLIAAEIEAPVLKGTNLVIDGGTSTGAFNVGSLVSTGEVKASKVVAPSVVTDALTVNGAIAGDSATLATGSIATLTSSNATISSLLKVNGVAEFVSDALFRANVNINGALTVAGITSAADIREGGVLLRDKYLGINAQAKDAVALDGQGASYYRNASNLNAGTLSRARLDGEYDIDITGRAAVASNADKLGGQSSSFYRNASNLNAGVLAAARLAGLYDIDISGRAALATNAEKLGGVVATSYARKDQAGSFSGLQTFNNGIRLASGTGVQSGYSGSNILQDHANGNVTVSAAGKDLYLGYANTQKVRLYSDLYSYDGAKKIASRDGNTLYEGGVALSSKYLSKTGTAENSKKLDNIDSSQFARRDIDPNFQTNVTVAGRIYAKNGLHVQGDWVRVDGTKGLYFNSYGGGWHMQDSTWIRAYGGKSIYTTGTIRGDAGIQVSNGVVVADRDGRVRYMNQDLDARYLKIGATAANSNLLDGLDSNYFRSASNLNAGTVNRARLSGTYDIDITGRAARATLADTATNANKLGGYAASDYARKNAYNTFSYKQTFNGGASATTFSTSSKATLASLQVNGTSDLRGKLYAKSGINVSGGDVYVNSSNDIKIGSISVKNISNRVDMLERNSGFDSNYTIAFVGQSKSESLTVAPNRGQKVVVTYRLSGGGTTFSQTGTAGTGGSIQMSLAGTGTTDFSITGDRFTSTNRMIMQIAYL